MKPKEASLKIIDLIYVLVPAIIWPTAVHLRKVWITPYCITDAPRCSPDQIPDLDLLSWKTVWMPADLLSFVTQDSAAVWALCIPALWVLKKNLWSWKASQARIFSDFLILLQITLWNGFATELSRLIAQRPRPFVFGDPARYGADPSNYTSFYSGHTSFTAAAAMFCILTLQNRQASTLWFRIGTTGSLFLLILTASFRVLAERHFITDTIAGTMGGFFVATLIHHFQWKKKEYSHEPI